MSKNIETEKKKFGRELYFLSDKKVSKTIHKMKKKRLSVIIPTYNEEKDILNCLESLKNQSYKNMEILVIDDGSTDNTRKLVRKFQKIKLIEGEHRGPGFSRNLGAKKAKGEILIFVDADMTFDKDYLKDLVKPILKDKNLLGTEEQFQTATNLNTFWSRCYGKYRSNPFNEKGKVFRAIRKKEFLEMGGFDPQYGYSDDQTFLFKYDKKSKVAKGAKCFHNNPSTMKEVFAQSIWMGSSENNALLKIPFINLCNH